MHLVNLILMKFKVKKIYLHNLWSLLNKFNNKIMWVLPVAARLKWCKTYVWTNIFMFDVGDAALDLWWYSVVVHVKLYI